MNHFGKKLLSVLAAGALGFSVQAQTTNVDVIVDASLSSFPLEMSWTLDDGASVLASEDCGTNIGVVTTVNLNLNDGTTYTFDAFDDWGDGWNGGTWSIVRTSDGAVLGSGFANDGLAGDGTDICDASQLEESFSFDPGAGISGCTDSTATNYNPFATVDDGSCLFPASNDLCQNAINIAVGSCYVGTNIGATFNGDTLPVACIDGDVTPNDIWFTTTVPASGNLTITLPQVPGISSIVELYESSCGVDSGILASIGACFNYGPGGGTTVGGLTPGASLLIRYWDFGSDQEGTIEICLDEPVSGCTDPCATNFDSTAVIDDGSCVLVASDADDCASAAMVMAGTTAFQTIGNSGSDITSCTSSDSVSAWFAYMVPMGQDSINIYTCGSSFDTGLSLWDACGGSEIACNDDGTPGGGLFGSTCDGSGLQSFVQLADSTLMAAAGTTIYIRVAGFAGQEGCGDLVIEEYATSCNSANVPTNQSHVNTATRVELSWDPIPAAVACQVQGQRLPTGPAPSLNVLAAPYNSANVPYAAAGAGTMWTWRVRCACSISPLDVSAFTAYGDTFSIPVARQADLVNTEDMVFPNPADNEVLVAYSAATAAQNVEFTLVDMVGRTIESRVIDVQAGISNERFDVSLLEDGIYFVHIQNGEQQVTHQITVSH